jgi:FkbM family methyltransferase
VGWKHLALRFPPFKRLHEERVRLRARLREARTQLKAAAEERARLKAQLREARKAAAEKRARLEARLEAHASKLLKLMEKCGVDLILDVGANTGQYARWLRNEGFRGEIISFEPLSDAFAALERACAQDGNWSCHKLAFGEDNGTATINISLNSASSSLLRSRDWATAVEPGIASVGQETVDVRRLDQLLPSLTAARRIFLKIDTQGFERHVLEGASDVMSRIAMVQLELAWTPAYEGQAELSEMASLMREQGFMPILIEPAWTDKNGVLREMDVVFVREPAASG